MPVLWWLQGPSEDLNRPLQNIVRNFEDGIIAQSIAQAAMKQLATNLIRPSVSYFFALILNPIH